VTDDSRPSVDLIVVMGVTGSGKTTTGGALATALGWSFYDGDDFHSAANVEKMSRGEPLNDDDRSGWLTQLGELIDSHRNQHRPMVLACSALRRAHRQHLRLDGPASALIFLRAAPEMIRQRLARRPDHFMSAALIPSQFATLEEPINAVVLDASDAPYVLVEIACARLGLRYERRRLRVGCCSAARWG
jgi:gluconokinase